MNQRDIIIFRSSFQKTAADIDVKALASDLKDLVSLVSDYSNYGANELFEPKIAAITKAVSICLHFCMWYCGIFEFYHF